MQVSKTIEKEFPEAEIVHLMIHFKDLPHDYGREQSLDEDSYKYVDHQKGSLAEPSSIKEIGKRILNDPEGLSEYDFRIGYLRTHRNRLGQADRLRHIFGKTGLYPLDEDPSQWHPTFFELALSS